MRIELEETKIDEKDNVLNPETKYKTDLTRKEKRLQEKEKLKELGFKAKLVYIWMYYKGVIFGIIGAIVLVFVALDLYDNSKKVTYLSMVTVGSGNFDTEAATNMLKENLELEGDYEEVSIISNFTLNETGDGFDYYGQMAYTTQMAAAALDVAVMPESLYHSLLSTDVFADLEEVLGAELYQSFGDQIDKNHIELTGEYFKDNFGIYYEPVCVAVFINSKNMDYAAKWISTLQ